jgi:HAD superfamily hydrolase (TIGR01450 family)
VRYDLSRYEAVLLDLDGTVFKEEHALPGAVELLTRYQATGRRYACLSNHTYSAVRISERLRRMGIEVDPAHVYTAGDAAADYVMEHFGERPRVFNLATESFREALNGRVEWAEKAGDACDVVVAGSPVSLFATEDRQQVAVTLLRSGARLLGMCADRVYPSPRGIEIGVGALTMMLAYAANVPPTFTGKPQPVFFNDLCRRLAVNPRACVLIGDNLESDIGGALSVGMDAIVTLTGVTQREHLFDLPEKLRPTGVIEDLRELL